MGPTLCQVASVGEQPAPILLRRLQQQRRGHVGLQVRSVRLRAAPVLPRQHRQRQLAASRAGCCRLGLALNGLKAACTGFCTCYV